ncbi:hypothetical protein ES707_21261 [subsurface metagenome]
MNDYDDLFTKENIVYQNKKKRIIKDDIKFVKIDEPIEIFCKQKYNRQYHIRGHITESAYNIDFIDGKFKFQLYYMSYHRLILIVLVNRKYQESLKEYKANHYQFGILYGNTKDEYLKIQTKHDLKLRKILQKIPKKQKNDFSLIRNSILEIDLKDIEIKKNSYLEKCVEEKKDIILLSLELYTDRVVSNIINDTSFPKYLKRIYFLPSYRFGSALFKGRVEPSIIKWFDTLYETVFFNLDHQFLNKKDYWIIMENIGILGYEWLRDKKISYEYVKQLNIFKNQMLDRNVSPFVDFCYSFYDDLIDDLISCKQIMQCQYCGDFFEYYRSRKYCSYGYADKDCRKKAANQRHYKKHKKEIKEKSKYKDTEI